jgi:hypothetical protein
VPYARFTDPHAFSHVTNFNLFVNWSGNSANRTATCTPRAEVLVWRHQKHLNLPTSQGDAFALLRKGAQRRSPRFEVRKTSPSGQGPPGLLRVNQDALSLCVSVRCTCKRNAVRSPMCFDAASTPIRLTRPRAAVTEMADSSFKALRIGAGRARRSPTLPLGRWCPSWVACYARCQLEPWAVPFGSG